jgi:hypothetical protein
MADTSRRGFFGLIAGAAAIPLVGKLPPVALTNYRTASVAYGPSLSEIVSTTLRARSATIADNLMKASPLLESLQRKAIGDRIHIRVAE